MLLFGYCKFRNHHKCLTLGLGSGLAPANGPEILGYQAEYPHPLSFRRVVEKPGDFSEMKTANARDSVKTIAY